MKQPDSKALLAYGFRGKAHSEKFMVRAWARQEFELLTSSFIILVLIGLHVACQ